MLYSPVAFKVSGLLSDICQVSFPNVTVPEFDIATSHLLTFWLFDCLTVWQSQTDWQSDIAASHLLRVWLILNPQSKTQWQKVNIVWRWIASGKEVYLWRIQPMGMVQICLPALIYCLTATILSRIDISIEICHKYKCLKTIPVTIVFFVILIGQWLRHMCLWVHWARRSFEGFGNTIFLLGNRN